MSTTISKIEHLLISQISIINQELAIYESQFAYSKHRIVTKRQTEKKKGYRSAVRKLHLIKKYANNLDPSRVFDLILGGKFEQISYGDLKLELVGYDKCA